MPTSDPFDAFDTPSPVTLDRDDGLSSFGTEGVRVVNEVQQTHGPRQPVEPPAVPIPHAVAVPHNASLEQVRHRQAVRTRWIAAAAVLALLLSALGLRAVWRASSVPAPTATAAAPPVTAPAPQPSAPVSSRAESRAGLEPREIAAAPPEPAPRSIVPEARRTAPSTAPASAPAVTNPAPDGARIERAPEVTAAEELRPTPAPPVAAPSAEPPSVVTPPLTDRAAIDRVLHTYEDSYDRLDAPSAAVIWPRVDTRALSRAFSTLAQQDMSFDRCDVTIFGASATARCIGAIRYVRRVGDQDPRVRRLSWSFALERVSDRWQIASVTAE